MAVEASANFDTKELLKLLERKATFHNAVVGLHTAVSSCSPNNESKAAKLWPLVQRCHTLLTTRYSSVDAWRAGQLLFTRCLDLPFHPREMASIRQFGRDAAQLAALDGEVPGAAGGLETDHNSALSLADILLMSSRDPDAHFDDAGPIVDDPERLRRAQVSGAAATAAPPLPEQQADNDSSTAGSVAAAAPRTRSEQRQDLQRAILEGVNAVYSGLDAVHRGQEAVEAELDSIISMIHGEEGGPGGRRAPPPASRTAMAALPHVRLAAADLERLGADSVCAVCTEELKLDDEVQLLPCRHSYHVACLKPWLDKHNSCPVCRHELPTDDARYEAQKEIDKEAEADRRGAANAHSHNEFMYI